MNKGIVTKIHNQLAAAENIGNKACAFSVEDTREILALLGKATEFRETIIHIVNHYPIDNIHQSLCATLCATIEEHDKK